jgi:TPR repeat protein
VPQDYAEAVEWYREAAEQGDASGQYELGLSYQNGRGVEIDLPRGYGWFQLAADQGNEPAKKEATALAALMSPSESEAANRFYQEFNETYSRKK